MSRTEFTHYLHLYLYLCVVVVRVVSRRDEPGRAARESVCWCLSYALKLGNVSKLKLGNVSKRHLKLGNLDTPKPRHALATPKPRHAKTSTRQNLELQAKNATQGPYAFVRQSNQRPQEC